MKQLVMRGSNRFYLKLCGVIFALSWTAAACWTAAAAPQVPRWHVFEAGFTSAKDYANPVQDATLTVTFTAPSGRNISIPGFWDGGRTWRVRFAPDQTGRWTYRTECSDQANGGLHNQQGSFECTAPQGTTRFQQHGPIRISDDDRYFAHADGTPFFWLADTAWNGALLSTDEEWDYYIGVRRAQKFTAVQFVATQWRAAPKGDREGQLAYTGRERIEINPAFFQRLDRKIVALNKAGLLAVPVMLWAIEGGSNPQINPGVSLPDDQAILLARYMVARWGAYATAWLLGGDGNYRGAKAERWKKIGRAVFGDIPHGPVSMHPSGMQWVWEEFKDEPWYDFVGYQSGHGDNEQTLRWLTEGPLTEDWMKLPHRPFINLEPPYENHIAYHSKKPHTDASVRRAIYWSLLNAPTAGVSYGGHGVWGWDDGTKPPTDHPGSGVPKPWREALKMPAAEQMKHLYDFFTGIDFWRLRPTPVFVVNQPGKKEPARYISAARTDAKDLMVVYVPQDRTVEIKLDALPPSPKITWINPRTGETSPAVGVVTTDTCQFPSPSEGDWLLLMKSEPKPAAKEKEGAQEKEKEAKPAQKKP